MKVLASTVAASLFLTACAPQLPKTALSIDAAPTFDDGSIMPSYNGAAAVDIARIPGMVCVPEANGRCSEFLSRPILIDGAKVSVTANVNATPQYHSLISDKYQVAADAVVLKAAASVDQLYEVKATVLATATVAANTEDSGFPGVDRIRSLVQAERPGAKSAYWISAANIISVTRNTYKKVNSSLDVNYSGVGVNGSTYNGASTDEQKIWIGVFAHRIEFEPGAPTPIVPLQSVQAVPTAPATAIKKAPAVVKGLQLLDAVVEMPKSALK